MAKTVGTSSILASIKQKVKGAWGESRKAEPKKGFASLPGGIRNGIARLVGASLGLSEENEKGQAPVVKFKFIVREPIEHEGVIVFKSHYIAAKTGDFPKPINEVLNDLSSDLQLLGVEPQGDDGLPDIDNWPEMLADLQTAKPYCKFHTWQGKDMDSSKFFVDGPCTDDELAEFSQNPTELGDVDKEAIVAAAEKGKPAPKAAAGRKGPPPKKAPPTTEVEEVTEIEEVEEVTEKSIPTIGDRLYVNKNGDQRTCEVVAVDEENKKADCKDEDGGKVYRVAFEKIEADNPSE